jgi:hypothetical protein
LPFLHLAPGPPTAAERHDVNRCYEKSESLS